MSFIPLMSPNISEEDIAAVGQVLRSGMLVQGEQVARLEEEMATYVGVRHAVAVANGTAALHLSLVVLGIGPGDEVIVPALSFVATANAVELVGARCVFVDVDRDTFNIDADALQSAISDRTRAIIPVHEFGLACDITRIVDSTRGKPLAIVEDAACALGASDNGQRTGAVGTLGCFSLHPRKAITSGEGGIITTDDDALAAQLRVLRNHGISMETGAMQFVAAGFNYRLTDFQAALVRGQFRSLEQVIRRRAELAQLYQEHLADEAWLSLPVVPAGKTHTWQTYHVVLDDSIDRDAVITAMRDRGVGTNFGAQCIPSEIYYRGAYDLDAPRLFPNAFRAARHGLALPLFEKLDERDVATVADTLKASVAVCRG